MILCDERLPYPAKAKLADFDQLVEINTIDLTYGAISGHSDIFCCPIDDVVVVSPSLPAKYTNIFTTNNINWVYGLKPIGFTYPESAGYNAVVTDTLLIHNLKITDEAIKTIAGTKRHIHVNQGYTRCNLLPLPQNTFITSDKGIYAVLKKERFEVLYVNPTGIQLEGFENGFIGGVCGIRDDKVFIAGTLSEYNEGQKIRDFLSLHSLTPVELYDGPLIDGGSILFI